MSKSGGDKHVWGFNTWKGEILVYSTTSSQHLLALIKKWVVSAYARLHATWILASGMPSCGPHVRIGVENLPTLFPMAAFSALISPNVLFVPFI